MGKQVAVPAYIPQNVYWAQFAESPRYLYYVCGRGIVIRVNRKNMRTQRIKPHLLGGNAMIYAAGKAHMLKHLVAREFLPYHAGSRVICRDGNPLRCDAQNLKVLTIRSKGK